MTFEKPITKFKLREVIAENISNCLQLAILLEVSAYPKAGNVHRTADFTGTKYEHFLASAIAAGPSFREAAEKGVMVSAQKLRVSEVTVGKLVKTAVQQIAVWQHGGNTLLGSMILLMPMAISAGISYAEEKFSIAELRRNLKLVVEATTSDDAVNLYDAINIAQPSGLGKVPELDVTDASSSRKIYTKNICLHDVFKISAPWDSTSSEWVNNYHITFDIGYPFLAKQLEVTKDTNNVTVNTFLKILSEVPDSLIARKAGPEKAKEVTAEAKLVLETGGLATSEGRKSLQQFDQKLRDADHKLNPGTTADLTSAALATAILNGYRP
jgi:triphosphoribosyl-dephospho-CoA synthase